MEQTEAKTADAINGSADNKTVNNANVDRSVDNKTENGAEQAKEKVASAFGKFDSAEKLLKAYNALEAEFTKRCQQMKELEAASSKAPEKAQDFDSFLDKAFEDEELAERVVAGNDRIREKIIAAYLAKIYEAKATPLLNSSTGKSALSPVKKPKDLKEAKALADKYFI